MKYSWQWFFNKIECEKEELTGHYVHETFPQMICYQGVHLFHTFCAVFFSVTFIIISIIVAINFYESRISSEDPMARKSSNGEVVFIINKIVLQVSFALFHNEIVLVLLLFTGASLTAYFNVIDDPYYDKIMATFFKIIALLYWWCNFMIFILLIIRQTHFDGGMIVWMIGLPFIMICGLSLSQDNLNALIKSQIKFKNDDDLLDHLKLILLLVKRQKKDKDSHLLLVGYIQKHQEICLETDCPLKIGNNKNVSPNDMDDMIARLIKVIERLYISGIKKFKLSIRLRISYAFFLMEKLNLKKKALEQLSLAENFNPGFEEEFLIYRYKKIIEDNIGEDARNSDPNEVQHEVDVVGMIAFESHMKFCVYFVKQAAEFNKKYWLELLKDNPSLEIVSEIGTQMDLQISKAKENWGKLTKMKANTPIIIKLYSKFLGSVLNEKDEGQQLLKSFNQLVIKNLKIKQLDLSEIHELEPVLAIAVVSSTSKAPGVIKKASSSFCTLFGYNHFDIISKKYSCIFPEIYLNHYKNFMGTIMENPQLKTGYFGENKNYFAKLKNGSIISIVSNARIHPSSNITFNDFLFVNLIQPVDDKTTKALLLVNKTGHINDVNSFSQTILNYSSNEISPLKLKIQQWVPKALVSDKFRGHGKNKCIVTNTGTVFDMVCAVNPILLKMRTNEVESKLILEEKETLVGFVVTLSPKQYQETTTGKTSTNLVCDNNAEMLNSRLIWNFVDQNMLIEEFKENVVTKTKRNSRLSIQRLSFQNDPSNLFIQNRIITKRLQYGKIVDLVNKKFYIPENNEVPTQEDVDFEESIFKENVKKVKLNELNEKNIIRKNLLKKIMKKESNNILVTIFHILIIIWIVASILFAILILVSVNNQVSQFNQNTTQSFSALRIINLSSLLVTKLYSLEYLETSVIKNGNQAAAEFIEITKILKDTNIILQKLSDSLISVFKSFSKNSIQQFWKQGIIFPSNLDPGNSTLSQKKSLGQRILEQNSNFTDNKIGKEDSLKSLLIFKQFLSEFKARFGPQFLVSKFNTARNALISERLMESNTRSLTDIQSQLNQKWDFSQETVVR